jgi:hypothetical protein
MPAFDGTGPLGKGPFTGRGQGYCVVERKEVFDMPRGDGTGPMGLGPMTGRAAGYCAGYSMPGYANPVSGRGFGRGAGSFGRSAGRGRRNWYYATGLAGWQRASMGMPAFGGAYPYAPEVTANEEMDILKNEADILKKQLEDIQARIESLEKVQADKSE